MSRRIGNSRSQEVLATLRKFPKIDILEPFQLDSINKLDRRNRLYITSQNGAKTGAQGARTGAFSWENSPGRTYLGEQGISWCQDYTSVLESKLSVSWEKSPGRGLLGEKGWSVCQILPPPIDRSKPVVFGELPKLYSYREHFARLFLAFLPFWRPCSHCSYLALYWLLLLPFWLLAPILAPYPVWLPAPNLAPRHVSSSNLPFQDTDDTS